MRMLTIVRQTNSQQMKDSNCSSVYLLLDMEYIFCAFTLNTLNNDKTLYVDRSRINQLSIKHPFTDVCHENESCLN